MPQAIFPEWRDAWEEWGPWGREAALLKKVKFTTYQRQPGRHQEAEIDHGPTVGDEGGKAGHAGGSVEARNADFTPSEQDVLLVKIGNRE